MVPHERAQPKQPKAAKAQHLETQTRQPDNDLAPQWASDLQRTTARRESTPPPLLSHATLQRAQAAPRTLAPNDILQLQRTVGNQAVSRMLDAQAKPPIQRDRKDTIEAGAGFEAGGDFERQLSRSKGGGAPLPKKERESFESSFGANFSNVRIHTDAAANQLSHSIQAKAFTHGNDIHFDAGEYNPTSSQGKHLLAHELTHTLQQGGGQQGTAQQSKSVQTKLQVGAANDRYEREADRVATQVSQPQHQHAPHTATSSSPRIQRAPGDPPATTTGQTHPIEQTKPTEKNDKAGAAQAATKTAAAGATPAPVKKKRLKAVVAVGTPGAKLDAAVKLAAPYAASYLPVNRSSLAKIGLDTKAIAAADAKDLAAAQKAHSAAVQKAANAPAVAAAAEAAAAKAAAVAAQKAQEAKAAEGGEDAEAIEEAQKAARAAANASTTAAKTAATAASDIAASPIAAQKAAQEAEEAKAAQEAQATQDAVQAAQDAAQAAQAPSAAPDNMKRNILYKSTGEKSFFDYRNKMYALTQQGYSITFVMAYSKADDLPLFFKLLGSKSIVTGTSSRRTTVVVEYANEAFIFDGTVAAGEEPNLVWQRGKGIDRKLDGAQQAYIEDSLSKKESNKEKQDLPSTPGTAFAKLRDMAARGRYAYLNEGGAELWQGVMSPNASPKVMQMTDSLRKLNEFKAARRGNAEEQGKLLLGLQENLKDLGNLKQESQQSAVSRLEYEVENEISANPSQLNQVSDDEKIKEMERVGFAKAFFAKSASRGLDLLYEAHASLSHKQLAVAQEAFDRLNPILRDKNGKLSYDTGYIVRKHNAFYFAQSVLTGYHHEAIGGAFAATYKAGMAGAGDLKQGANGSPASADATGNTPQDIIADETGNNAPQLTPKEKSAVQDYSGDAFRNMNGTMQDIRLTEPDEQQESEKWHTVNQRALSGLSKLPSWPGKILYRGDNNRGGLAQFAQVGSTFRLPIAFSTSQGKFVSWVNPTIAWGIRVAKNTCAKDIASLSQLGAAESEVLIPVGTKLKIVDIFRADETNAHKGILKKPEMFTSEKTGAAPTGDVLDLIRIGAKNGKTWPVHTVIMAEEQSEGSEKE